MKQKISITLTDKLVRDIDVLVDNILIRNRSQALEFLVKKALQESKTVVILAGENKQKASRSMRARYAVRVGYMTLIERAVKKLCDSGFKAIYIVATRPTLAALFHILGDGSAYDAHLEFVQEEAEEGTAAALKLLRGKIKTAFLVVWCDIIFDHVNLLELWQQHLQEKTVATMLLNSTPTSQGKGLWGHVTLERNKITSYMEKPARDYIKSTIFFGGIFVAEPDIFGYAGKSLEFDVFPELARRRLLGGQVSSAPYLHVHTLRDVIRVKKVLAKL